MNAPVVEIEFMPDGNQMIITCNDGTRFVTQTMTPDIFRYIMAHPGLIIRTVNGAHALCASEEHAFITDYAPHHPTFFAYDNSMRVIHTHFVYRAQ